MAGATSPRVPATARLPPRPLRLPTVDLAVAINEAVREVDEWFVESDDLERLARAIDSVGDEVDPIVAAGKLAFRVAHAQAFGEGNKRIALLLARWLLDHNGVDGELILPVDDEALGDLLVKAASGVDVGRSSSSASAAVGNAAIERRGGIGAPTSIRQCTRASYRTSLVDALQHARTPVGRHAFLTTFKEPDGACMMAVR